MTAGNGYSANNIVEILDLGKATSTCADLPNNPITGINFYAVGGIDFSVRPLLCAGNDYYATNYTYLSCYAYNGTGWQLSPFTRSLKNQTSGSYAFNPDLTAYGRAIAVTFNKIDVLTQTGWAVSTTELPFMSEWGCTVNINSTTFLIIVGYQELASYSNETFFYNVETRTLTPGPQLPTPRVQFQCARMKVGPADTRVVITGGLYNLTYLRSTDVYFVESGYWTSAQGHIQQKTLLP